jgi:hypothetical protein
MITNDRPVNVRDIINLMNEGDEGKGYGFGGMDISQ